MKGLKDVKKPAVAQSSLNKPKSQFAPGKEKENPANKKKDNHIPALSLTNLPELKRQETNNKVNKTESIDESEGLALSNRETVSNPIKSIGDYGRVEENKVHIPQKNSISLEKTNTNITEKSSVNLKPELPTRQEIGNTTQIKVVSRFRPLNATETVKYLTKF